MKKVSITYKIPEAGIDLLKGKYDIWVNPKDKLLTKEELKEIAKASDALITMLADPIDKEVLEAGKDRLKIIANYAVGYNNIDIQKAKELGIYVTNTPDVLTETTADLAWALMLAVARRIVESDNFTREGKFDGWKPELFLGTDVYGKTLGIIGFGSIGQAVARRAIGFNMKVYYYQRHRLSSEKEKALNATYLPLDELLKVSDYVSLHVPLINETYHMLNKEKLSLLKKSAFVINTARGPVIDEQVLYEKLKNKEIAGAALDVYENEPQLTPGLKDLDNVVLTPHIGSASHETRSRMAQMVAKDIIQALEGETPEHLIWR
ncbi:2-hydroxyacid dehydrogenase [Petrotoga olearia]|uniref:Glyoxylate reductase n=2 Tax=Petrotoga olearia TaxID=156203 RepID=A0A2K1NZV5_9BACT|nr:D-glycerate dehydrogenase [Petrotoga olearia]PNR96061.1 glyoxylate reductase [Petrotoga olearia DSM 13574]RMA71482.1 glyoxylate reductase [Petrotoga olearia]